MRSDLEAPGTDSRWPRVLNIDPPSPLRLPDHNGDVHLVHESSVGWRRKVAPSWIAGRQGDWDVVHLHLRGAAAIRQVITRGIRSHVETGVPVVLTIHNAPGWTRSGRDHALQDAELRVATAGCAALVTSTTLGAARLEGYLGRAIDVIPRGPVLSSEQRRSIRRRFSDMTVLRPHLLLPITLPEGTEDLIRLGQALEAGVGGIQVLVRVSGDQEGEARRLMGGQSLHLSTGSLRPDVVLEEVAAAWGLLMPSHDRGHSLLADLAADVGTPVITPGVGPLTEQVERSLRGRRIPTSVATDGTSWQINDLTQMLRSLSLVRGPAPEEKDRSATAREVSAAYEGLHRSVWTQSQLQVVGQDSVEA